MKYYSRCLQFALLLVGLSSAGSWAEDIDIFAGTNEVNTSLPNVIFVLDNTSNWSRQSQQWPGGLVQGQSEVRAIKNALAGQVGKLNVGIFEYVTGGSSADNNAGYTRLHLQELTAARLVAVNDTLDRIYDNIAEPDEKRDSSNPYGDLPWDFYNYLSGGAHSNSGTGTPSNLADSAAYRGAGYSLFQSPLGAVDACADTYMIFIGNNVNGSIASDDVTNSNALKALYTAAGASASDALAGDSGTPLAMPEFVCQEERAPDVEISPPYEEFCNEEDTTVTITRPGAFHPAQIAQELDDSSMCYKESELDACSEDENSSGGACLETDGTTNCICTATRSSDQEGCLTTVNPARNRTFRRVVVGDLPEYNEPDTEITVLAGECTPAVEAETQLGEMEQVCRASGLDNTTGGTPYNFDDWAKFLHNYGAPLTVTVDGETYSERVKVTTYTIDVFNRQQSPELSSVWFSAAEAGGGRYFQAKNESQIVAAINSALGDILAVSTSFSAVSLPLSATNRARVDNQVYIGMFRPSRGKKPRWFGNLKRFQLALFNGRPRLADVNLHSAVNPLDDSLVECAESFWSEDTATYWENLGINPAPLSECTDVDVTNSGWSDLPDGPFVEKGGAAQQARQGPAADLRTIYTVQSATALRALTSGDAVALGGDTVLDYLRGSASGIDEVMPAVGLRASIHGDVVHSRPLSIRHSADDVTLYYGTNDGVYRAVDASDGTERWALVAPEHFGKISRLHTNSPLIAYTGAADPGSTLKDYFFDGATGQLAIYGDDGALESATIFPTQRRGGRMVYALDVTDPDAAPDLLWRVGCPNLDNDTDCTTGFNNIGQTWSTPIGGYSAGYVDGQDNPKAIVVFGGGFDNCLNADAAAYPATCSSANGKGVYILDATTGTLLAHLPTDAPVVTELSPIDIDFDGNLDFAYAMDVAGNMYRVNFADLTDSNPENAVTALESDDWSIVKIASNSDNERRFYNAPTAGAFKGTVLVSVGSGDRERPLEANYPYAEDVQNRFYVFFDEPYKTFVANPADPMPADEATTVNLDGDTMLAVVAPGDDQDPASFTRELDGWYMDLTDRGEQVANPGAIGGGKVFFNTFQPGGVSNGLCSRPLGIGTSYAVNAFGPEFTSGTLIDGPGIPIPPVIATVLIPPGLPPCDGDGCPEPPEDPCAGRDNDCEVKTVCIGCDGFEPIELIPDAPPIRRRIFFTEDIDLAR